MDVGCACSVWTKLNWKWITYLWSQIDFTQLSAKFWSWNWNPSECYFYRTPESIFAIEIPVPKTLPFPNSSCWRLGLILPDLLHHKDRLSKTELSSKSYCLEQFKHIEDMGFNRVFIGKFHWIIFFYCFLKCET